MPVKVAVNGYGTIGKRIASAILKNSDFHLVGVAKYTPDYKTIIAAKQGIRIFVPRDEAEAFKSLGIEPEGYVDYLFEEAELIYDASPGGQGAKNKELYIKYRKPAVFQGGEDPSVAEISYSTLCNYSSTLGKRYIRVVSCNTTGLLRILCSLGVANIRRVFATIIRRASDPGEDMKGPVNSIRVDSTRIPSHHGLDVKTVIGNVDVETVAVAVPTTLMHMHVIEVMLKNTPCVSIEELRKQGRGRIVTVSSTLADSTGKLLEIARDIGRPRNDVYENIVFTNMFSCREDRLVLIQAVHQEAIVIPENIDVAYGIMNIETDVYKVVDKVNSLLGIGQLHVM
jgi:glyceraldehyde-3-phosphate dehydrogenase (NAD(P))